MDILMCMRTTLQRWGNSQGVRLPKSIVDSIGLRIGEPLILEVSGDDCKITISPAIELRPVRGRYRIQDLIAESAPDAFAGEHDWGKSRGKEVW
jgi:antitoxin MazE